MQTIGKYQVLEILGQGGMGVVYRARDEAIGRQVALKVMRPEVVNSADLRERFLREARAAGNLQHPNIVVVHELGEDGGSPYIAMEFLAGQALDKALDDGALATTAKLQIFAQICDGLQYAHEAGVVHRDIKPANVMLARNQVPKLLDFGIARLAGSQITRSTAIIGTVSYMSPEQIRGKGVDARSDIFSAGVMLYEMLSGRRPFDQDSDFETMQAIVGQEPPELQIDGVISPDTLATILRRAIEKDPANRYQTAAEFAEAVRGYLRAQERSGMAETVIRSRPEPQREVAETAIHAAEPTRRSTPLVVREPAIVPSPASAAAAAPRLAADSELGAHGDPRPIPTTKRFRRVGLWLLGLVIVGVLIVLFVPARWLGFESPHHPHVQGKVQFRLVAPPNFELADKLQLKGTDQSYELERTVIADETDLTSAVATVNPQGQPEVEISLSGAGAAKLRNGSGQNIGRSMAVVVGGELVEVATIQTELGDRISITGMKSPAEAEELAKRINGEAPPGAASTFGPTPAAATPAPEATTSTPPPKPAAPEKVRIAAGVVQGNLISAAKPQYPPLARTARIQGPVVLHAVIGKDGKIKELKVVSGHPMLTQAALDAVKQWVYKPYMLNGEAVEVETTVTVNFQLDTASASGSADSGTAKGPIYKVGAGGVTAPKAVYTPEPEYSEKARKEKYQGTVEVALVVGADGYVRDPKVVRPLGEGLDEKALQAVRQWRFEPATKDGKPVAVTIDIEVAFRLY